MDEKVAKAKLEMFLQEMKFLEADLEYHTMVLQSMQGDFLKHYDERTKRMGVVEKIREASKKNKQQPPPPPGSKPRPSKKSKEVYKKIATIAHPDKLLHLSDEEREEMQKKFMTASDAISNNMMLTLYQEAQDVGVEMPPPTLEDLQTFEEELNSLKVKIDDMENNLIWHYANAKTDDHKEEIMKRYVYSVLTNLPK